MIEWTAGSLAAKSSRQSLSGKSGSRPDGEGQRLASTTLGVALLFGFWFLVSSRQPELIFPSPGETWDALADLARDGSVVVELARTLGRAAVGLLSAFVVGGLWGAATGRSRWAAAVSQPALSSMMAMPPIVVVALGLVWFGPSGAVARLVVVLVSLPLIVVAVQEAVRSVDSDLLEMAASFQLSRITVLRHIFVPAITSPVLAAVTVVTGQALRVVVMAELLSSADGIGSEIARSRVNLETADLFAWAVVLVLAVLLIENVILRPLSDRVLSWRTPTTRP